MFNIEQIDHVALTVRDLERSIAWYQDILGLERRYQETWGNRPVMLCAGTTCLALFSSAVATPSPPPDFNHTIGMRHLAFRVNRASFQQAQAEFRNRGLEFVFQDHRIAHSIYLHDPDGYEIELTTYEQ